MKQKPNNTRSAAALALLALLVAVPPSGAHNIKVDNVRMRGLDTGAKEVTIEFDLRWENAWRNEVNHDAAWVFAKFRAPDETDWQHAYLVADAGAHSAPDAVIAVGTNDASGIGAGLGMGVFVYADANQAQGPADYPGTRLRWDFGASGYDFTPGTAVDVSVHAIEMVYVDEGPFYVGSGGMENGRIFEGGGGENPYLIANTGPVECADDPGKLWGLFQSGHSGMGGIGTIPSEFPNGYSAFYCMKYNITQGQYAAFLNLLSAAQQAERAYTDQADRHSIRLEEGVYVALAPDRACNWISWVDGAYYAAWAGLRPMTEFEYEKACRGPEAPVPNEYAWGATDYTEGSDLQGEDGSGTEWFAVGNSRTTSSGPVRAGIFATSGSDRVSAGATYWGIMDMSGNVGERAVTFGNDAGRAFTGLHGSGTYHLPATWPATNASGAGIRGGHTSHGGIYMRLSDRHWAVHAQATRMSTMGWRAVRSAP